MTAINISETATVKKPAINPVIIISTLFFIFGFVTWLNSVLVPYLKIACELHSNAQAYLVVTAFYLPYLVMAVPSAWLLKVLGFKNGMGAGLVIMALGALIFIPAAMSRMFAIFLVGLFVQGSGLAVLQSAANPFITILGPPESAAKRISIMGIFNKAAGSLAPIALGAAVALKDTDALKKKLLTLDAAQKAIELNQLASKVILPYVLMVIALIILAVLIYFVHLPEIDTNHEDDSVAAANADKTSIFHFPHLILGVIALFLYVGAEVIAGDTIISYGSSLNIPTSTAQFFTTCTLVSMIVGYIIGIFCIPKIITQQKALVVCAILGFVLTVCALVVHGYYSVFCIALLGLANSLMWPAIWPLGLSGLGRFTKIGSSLLVMGIAGAAVFPPVYGLLVDALNAQKAYVMLIPIYLFILYFATIGYKKGKHVVAV